MPRRIPTIVGLLLVILVVGGIMYVSEKVLRNPSIASGSQKPENVEVSNITDVSFTISWTTQTPTSGALDVTSSLTKHFLSYDERDETGKLGKYITHNVSVRNLQASTEHTIKILSGGKSYTDERVSRVRTAPSIPSASGGLEPAHGTVRTSSGVPADGALVYLTIEGGQKLSTIAKSSGSWLIPLSLVRTTDLSAYLPIIDRMTEQLIIRLEGEETSAITDTLNDSPVPEMTIGKTYDFRKLQAKTTDSSQLALRPSPTSGAVDSSKPIGGSILGTQTVKTHKVTLTQPTDGSALATTLPLVAGTGIPNAVVAISLGMSRPISGSTKVSPDGTWNFTPPKALAPGKQSVTISTVDGANKPVAITHLFEILKSGTQVLGDATPSATLTPLATDTPVVVPTSTLAGEPVPTSGSTLPTILLILLSIGLLASGAVAFVK